MNDTEQIQEISQETILKTDSQNQFGVAATPFHLHTGADSPQIDFASILNRLLTQTFVLPGITPATTTNYGVIFIAPFKCIFTSASEVHGTKGTDGSAVTLQMEKLTGTTASGSGTSLLSAGFNLKGTINTVQSAVLASIPKKTFSLAKGDRIGIVLTGTPTAVAQMVITYQLTY